MRRATIALVLLTCAGIAGCTKNEEPREPAPSRDSAPIAESRPADLRPVIVAFGDSLSEGFGADPGKSFPDYLQKALEREGYRYRVVNMGVSGDTTTGGLNRLQAAVRMQPEIVILELGGNDGLRGVPVASTKANLERMIQSLRAEGIRVVLAGMTLPPNYGSEYIRDFERAYKDLAQKYKVALVPFLLEDIVRQLAKNTRLMQRDGIHPTAEGNAVVAETVLKYLKPVLKK